MGLAFVVYPEAVNTMAGSTLWAILFFAMLITLGLDSQFAMLETVTTAAIDRFPDVLRPRKALFLLAACFLMFLCGIPLCAQVSRLSASCFFEFVIIHVVITQLAYDT